MCTADTQIQLSDSKCPSLCLRDSWVEDSGNYLMHSKHERQPETEKKGREKGLG